MNFDASILNYFLQAGIVVKIVMLILITASIFSWAYILQRGFYLKADLTENRCITTEELEAYCTKHGLQGHFETSAADPSKAKHNITDVMLTIAANICRAMPAAVANAQTMPSVTTPTTETSFLSKISAFFRALGTFLTNCFPSKQTIPAPAENATSATTKLAYENSASYVYSYLGGAAGAAYLGASRRASLASKSKASSAGNASTPAIGSSPIVEAPSALQEQQPTQDAISRLGAIP